MIFLSDCHKKVSLVSFYILHLTS